MFVSEIKLKGALVVELERREDVRGFFALSWSQTEFERLGLNSRLLECNISFNSKKGTLRGMHFQVAPYAQAKLVRCTSGSIYDVIIDLREDSPTFKQWSAVELTAENHRALYIPEGFAHGFQTLEDRTEILYQMSEIYAPEYARGIRWNDPLFSIEWPPDERIIVARDSSYGDWKPSASEQAKNV
ncbi:MAG: dTDP-4-dehydrorhamnose 3,5-epimerase [Pyrinomonadaceae bacterium]|nr:dTDP-4-dehydrorhamnose 3,5-epimerase [Pyrinomonadaceae bacterium]